MQSFVRVDHEFDEDTFGYLQFYGNFENTDEKLYLEYKSVSPTLEGQLTFEPTESHEVTVGGSVEWSYFKDYGSVPDYIVLPDAPFNDCSSGLFIIDTWKLSDRLTFESQLRGDYFSRVREHFDWAGRATAMYAVDSQQDHVVRASFAKAYRVPNVSLRELLMQRGPLPSPPNLPGSYAFELRGDSDLRNEHVYSYELGYRGQLTDRLKVNLDAYYRTYRNLIGMKAVDATRRILADDVHAQAWGAEAQAAYETKDMSLSLWYCYNGFATDRTYNQDVRGYLPARHKLGATARVFLPDDWTVNANYRYTSETPGDSVTLSSVDSSSRLDLTLAKLLPKWNAELLFGVADVLNDSASVASGISSQGGNPIPGRTVFVRFQWRR